MRKPVTGFVLVLLLGQGAMVAMSDVSSAGEEFRIVSCFMPNEDVASLTFRDDRNRRRHISFSISGKFSVIETERSKAAIEWDRIVAVRAKPDLSNPLFAQLAVELAPDTGFRPPLVDLGLIDRLCLERVRGRYEPYLRFVDAPQAK